MGCTIIQHVRWAELRVSSYGEDTPLAFLTNKKRQVSLLAGIHLAFGQTSR